MATTYHTKPQTARQQERRDFWMDGLVEDFHNPVKVALFLGSVVFLVIVFVSGL